MPAKFIIGNKCKLSIVEVSPAFIAGYNPAAPVPPTGLVPLVGGTSANEKISSEDKSSTIFGDSLGFADGIVTGQSWSIDYSYNSLPNDPGFKILDDCGLHATEKFVWIKKEDPAPPGASSGRILQGIASVTDLSSECPSDGIVSGSASFTGRGAPFVTPAA